MFLEENKRKDNCTPGEKTLSFLFKGQSSKSLDALRHRMCCVKVRVGATLVQVHCLTPTLAIAKFHSERAYVQTQEWMEKRISPLNQGR